MENGSESTLLERTRRKAEKLLKDSEGMQKLANQAKEKMKSVHVGDETLDSLFDLVNTFIRMLSAHLRGLYREIPWRTMALLVAGLLYFVNPFDLVPDFIPVAGLLDDLTFLLLILKSIRKDVDLFKEWEVNLAR